MVEIKVIKEKCPSNHRCPAVQVCPVGALIEKGFEPPTIDDEKCTKCGKCTRVCPTGALTLIKK